MSLPEPRALAQETPQQRYDRQVALVMRMASWLSSPAAQLLSAADWDKQFTAYQEQSEEVRQLGDDLQPTLCPNRDESRAEYAGGAV